jgi:hypothetical protein
MLDSRSLELRLFAMVCLAGVIACKSADDGGTASGAAGASGGGNAGTGGNVGATGAAGTSATGGGAGAGQTAGTTGQGGSVAGSPGTTGVAGSTGAGGVTGSAGRGGSSASGSAGTTGTGGSGAGAPAISGLMITANPNSVVSCFVSWTTDKAATSTVQFGQNGYQWEISDTTQVTSHKVLVIGMRAQQMYGVKAISTSGAASASATGTFMTGTLPAQIPAGKVMINDTARSQPGWTLMNVQKGQGDTRARSDYPPYAVMYDSEGQVVWYYVDGTHPDVGGAVSTQLTDKGVLIGPTWDANASIAAEVPREVDFAGNKLWECTMCGTKNFSHHASKISNGHYMLLEYVTTNGLQNPIYREVDADNQVVWSLDYAKLVPPPSGSTGDWCHGNAITVDIAKNIVYANCRWAGLLKTTYTNPTKQWLLQGTYIKTKIGDFTFSPTSSAFSDTHDPEIHDDGTICFFDNGGYGTGAVGGNTSMFHSRAVEYKIDETAKTATLTWEFPGNATVPDAWYTSNWYTPFWGDVDRLPNGNYLVAAGIRAPPVESRVFEVTKDDRKVVWEFRFPADYGVYRADRITPPLVHAVTN